MSDVVGKLWGFCHTLRHDGGVYVEKYALNLPEELVKL